MARDGSGTYSLPATMATANAVASSTTVNSVMSDVAQALTDSINKDGTKAFAAAQSMGNNKITSLAAGTALTDAAQVSQVQKGTVAQATTVGGTADAITLAFTPAITSYTTGMRIRWTSGGANTVAGATVNIDSLGAKTVKKNPGAAALIAGDLGASGTIHEAVYDGTYFILLNPVVSSTAASDSAAGVVELATTTETLTGTDTGRAVTPDGLAALWEQGSNIASDTTIAVGEGGYFVVTGTTTITDIDPSTDKAGREFDLRFADALTLTHGSNLILPGAANITTAAGDVARFRSEGSDTVRCVGYMKADGSSVTASASMTLISTLTTTSGTTHPVTGISSAYRALYIEIEGVSFTGSVALTIAASANNGSSYGTAVSLSGSLGNPADTISGSAMVYNLRTSAANACSVVPATSIAGGSGFSTVSVMSGNAGAGGPYDAIRFAGGTFDAGTIRVYGVK